MAAPQALIDAIDEALAYFNARKMDLPDTLFDRKAQFVLNGAPFETLLSTTPADPVVLMLARGAAMLSVSVGETIDSTYLLERVEGGALHFTYLPLRERQSLPFGAGP